MTLYVLFVFFRATFQYGSDKTMNNAVMHTTSTRIGFSEAAAQAIVEGQGIDSLDEIRLMTDVEIESLCKIVR